MKNSIKVMAAFLFAALLLSGCGGKEEAEEFLYRTLDERLQGDMSEAEGENDTRRIYDEHHTTVIFFTDAFLLGDLKADDGKREEFDKISEKILSAARYKVTDAKKSDSGYSVAVEIQPNKIFISAEPKLKVLSKKITEEAKTLPKEKQEAFAEENYIEGAQKILMELSEKPSYGEKKTVWVNIEKNDGENFLSDQEWTLFLSKLFVLP